MNSNVTPETIKAHSLTYQQAAVRLSVSALTIRRWRAQGRIKVRVFSPTLVRIPLEEIERLENEALGLNDQSKNDS